MWKAPARTLLVGLLSALALAACAPESEPTSSDYGPGPTAAIDSDGVSSSLQRDEEMFLSVLEEEVPYMVEGLPDAELISIHR